MNDKYQEFYERIIEFDKYIEVRALINANHENKYMSSFYPENYKQLSSILRDPRHNNNYYIGVNSRPTKGRKIIDIPFIKMIVFDIEAIDEKPAYSDIRYYNKLKRTIDFLSSYLYENYKLKINAVVESGRGMHVYIKLNEEIKTQEYKNKYKILYKKICSYVNKNNPSKGIKLDSMCHDATRILGAPGTLHIKYPEMPMRKIIYLNTNTNNQIKNELDKQKEITPINPKDKKSIKNCTIKRRYTNKTIFEAPEYKVFEHSPIEGTGRNNKLLLALQLLMNRDGITNVQEIKQRIEEQLGTTIHMNFNEKEYPDYSYSERILNKYVIDNMQWAVDSGFKLPYKLYEEKEIKRLGLQKRFKNTDRLIGFEDTKVNGINTLNEFIEEIRRFNQRNMKRNVFIEQTFEALEKNIMNNIEDDTLKEFVKQNNLIKRLKYLM